MYFLSLFLDLLLLFLLWYSFLNFRSSNTSMFSSPFARFNNSSCSLPSNNHSQTISEHVIFQHQYLTAIVQKTIVHFKFIA
ncbi:hypothetical protein CW304_13215 [Bacillus sp. UFRGS-B20]|nr:hypothetical protein CW304_13215 [Bacillus sp. UFRGS-B20]